MELINYIFTAIFSYLGIFVGYRIIKLAPEEKKPGEKYFKILKPSIFIISILIYFLLTNWMLIELIIGFGLIIVYFVIEYKTAFAYTIFSILFFLLSNNPDHFLVIASIIFAYGLVYGTSIENKKQVFHQLHFIVFLMFFALIF